MFENDVDGAYLRGKTDVDDYVADIVARVNESILAANRCVRPNSNNPIRVIENDVDDAYLGGKTDVDDDIAEIVARVNERILAANRCVRLDEIKNEFDISHGSLHKIIAEHLELNPKFELSPTAITQ
ncbi:hypothetical protein AVEN_77132-1 [Araneus ventricosus]|uniref:Uncharacterized protein n=2 Tax=Araneus ventricosus TaxID=182803 RepID=A0A4Y2R8G1_ARAVE|nr:hypothetical protein AVEN_77132-1 [Araneus ventricosus]